MVAILRKAKTLIIILICLFITIGLISVIENFTKKKLEQKSIELVTSIYQLDINSSKEHLAEEVYQEVEAIVNKLKNKSNLIYNITSQKLYSMDSTDYEAAINIKTNIKDKFNSDENSIYYLRWSKVNGSYIIVKCEHVVSYKFPLKPDDIQEVLTKNNIKWKYDQTKLWHEGHNINFYNSENDKKVSTVSSFSKDGLKGVSVMGYPESKSSDPIPFTDIERMINVAGYLYGNPKECELLYQELLRHLEGVHHFFSINMIHRINDNHFNITSNKDSKNNDILSYISIKNTLLYEETQRGRIKTWTWKTSHEKQYNLEIIENASLSDLPTDKDCALVITGKLKDIKKLNNVPKYINPGEVAISSIKKDLLQATLYNDTGSIPVILPVTTLTEEELAQTRDHYIYYFAKDNSYIIKLIVLKE